MKKLFLTAIPVGFITFAVAVAVLYFGTRTPSSADSSKLSHEVNALLEDVPRESFQNRSTNNALTTEQAMLKYVLPYGRLRMEAQNWTSPEQLDPDKLVRFGCDIMTGSFLSSYSEFADHHRTTYPESSLPEACQISDNTYAIPQDQLEETIARYFNVSTAHLRRSSLYDEARQAYVLELKAPDEDAVPQVTAVMRENDVITITFNMLIPKGPWESDGNAGQYRSSQYHSSLIMRVKVLNDDAFQYQSVSAAQRLDPSPS